MGTLNNDLFLSTLLKKILPCSIFAVVPVFLLLRTFLFCLPPNLAMQHPKPTITINTDSSDPISLSSPSSSTVPSSSAAAAASSSSSSSSSSSLSPSPPLAPPPPPPLPPPPPPPPPPPQEKERLEEIPPCDYSKGAWVHDQTGPLYNDRTCATIKEGRNCISHGKPDKSYLYWRWKPKVCKLPRFEPSAFFKLFRNKHIAFIGDSLSRNQAESLMCLLSAASSADLIYDYGEDNKFRRWNFPTHNVNVSTYWSPFLVDGVEKDDNGAIKYNRLFLDRVHEKWASEMDQMDMIVLTIGHWFLHSAVFYEGSFALGCHSCSSHGLNHSEIGFYNVYAKAFRTTLKSIIKRRGENGNGKGVDVIVTTFTPAHFEGEWDKAGACPKTRPYREREKKLEGMDKEMLKAQMNEVKITKQIAKKFVNVRIEALDVTKLSLLRPDGHPGPYMHPFPFAHGVKDRVQNDCVHWCLPGPIDTWNEILLKIMKRLESQSRRGE